MHNKHFIYNNLYHNHINLIYTMMSFSLTAQTVYWRSYTLEAPHYYKLSLYIHCYSNLLAICTQHIYIYILNQ